FSEETRGTTMKVSGLFLSRNSVGEDANFCVDGATLERRNFLTSSTLLSTSGISFSSLGVASTSQKHHRFFPFKNSCAETKGRIYFPLLGSLKTNAFFSSSERIKLPPSNGMFPKLILGTSHSGVVRLVINISFASTR